ncbi:MAG: hypothetical protein H3C34_18095 [Caldilineaceae bacterium]|nr:hypothetical protein [Caldilineaceae bacterium]
MMVPRMLATLTAALALLMGVYLTGTHSFGAHLPVEPPPAGNLIPQPAGTPGYLPVVLNAPPAHMVIAAAYIDSALSDEPDEAILLWNSGWQTQALAGWSIHAGARQATFPMTTTIQLAPGERLWCTAQAAAFARTFGEPPACVWDDAGRDEPLLDKLPIVQLDGNLVLGNSGGAIVLRDAMNRVADTLVYGDYTGESKGWDGLPARLYTRGQIGRSGQVWQRKLDPQWGQPLDTDRATDWASDLADLAWGRRVRMAGWQGWDAAGLFWPPSSREMAQTTVAVGPEGLFEPVAALLQSAQHSIDLSIYALEHPTLARLLSEAAARGVQVRVLLEGSPPGGITDLQKWCVRQIVEAGGDVRYAAVHVDAPKGYRKRYRYAHAKYGLIDGAQALVGSENFTREAMPEPAAEPVGGRRGFYLFTDAPGVIAALSRIFAMDWAPDRFYDLQPYLPEDPRYGGPPPDFVPPPAPRFPVDMAPFATAVVATGAGTFSVISAPENALRPDGGLNELLTRARAGDEILALQLYEHMFWGDSKSNPIADPNPRLQMMVDAARRGARVRLLLDSFFDDAESLRSNRATVDYVRAMAAAEGLDLDARLGNPTGGGIHAKVVLVRVGGETWSAVGSLNGGEVSHKINREVVLIVDIPAVYARLSEVFWWDWERAEWRGSR